MWLIQRSKPQDDQTGFTNEHNADARMKQAVDRYGSGGNHIHVRKRLADNTERCFLIHGSYSGQV